MIEQLAQESNWMVILTILISSASLLLAVYFIGKGVHPVLLGIGLAGISMLVGISPAVAITLVAVAWVISGPTQTTDSLIRSEIYRQRL